MHMFRWRWTGFILAGLLFPLTVWADIDSFEATLWRPVTDSSPYLTVYESHVRPRGGYSFGLIFNYAEDPLHKDNFLNVNVDPVGRYLAGHFLGAFSAADFLAIGLDFPI